MNYHIINFLFVMLLTHPTLGQDKLVQIQDLTYNMRKEERRSEDIYGLASKFRNLYRTYTRKGFPDPNDYFKKSATCYNLITSIYEGLSVASTQEERESYASSFEPMVACRTNGDWLRSGYDYSHLLEIFPDMCHATRAVEHNGRQTTIIDFTKLYKFCNAIKVVLNETEYTASYPRSQTLRISGDFLRLRDVVKAYENARTGEEKSITEMEIFARDTLILDDELKVSANSTFTMVVIAPKWDILTMEEIPQEFHPSIEGKGWEPRLQISNMEGRGSVIFGIGMSFRKMHGGLTIMVNSEPRQASQVAVYQLVPEGSLQKARTLHHAEFLTPTIYLNGFDFHRSMIDYVDFLVSEANSIRMKVIGEFLEKMYSSDKFALKMFSVMGFAREIQLLEKHFLQLYWGNANMFSVYKGLDSRYIKYLQKPKSEENGVEYVELRGIISTALWSKTKLLCPENKLIINLQSYLTTSISDSIKMGDVQKREHTNRIMMYNKDMKENIEEELGRVTGFIDNDVLPQINMMNAKLDMTIQQLLGEIAKLKEDVKANLELRKKEELKLKGVAARKRLFSLLAAVGGAILALGTMSAGSFIWIGGSAMVLGTISSWEAEPAMTPKIEMPPAMENVKRYIQSTTSTLDYLIHIIGDEEPTYLNDLKEKINHTKENLQKGVDTAPLAQVATYLEEKESELNGMSPVPTNALNIVHKVQENLEVARFSSPEIYTQYYRNDTALEILRSTVDEKVPADIKIINEYERSVHSILVPSIQFLNNYTLNIVNMTSSQSLAAIDVSRWKAETVLSSIKKQISRYTEGLTEGEQMVDVIDMLERAVSLVFTLLSRTAAYMEYLKLVDYIANVNSVPFDSAVSANVNIIQALDALKYIARFNIAIMQYRKVIESYRLFAFPFVAMIAGADNLDLDANRDIIKTTQDLATKAEFQLTYLSLKMTDYKTDVIGTMDVDVMEEDFDGSSERQPVFYTWSFESSDPNIDKLFSGESVKLSTNIKNGVSRNAVKFKRVGLRFKSANPDVQKQLDAALDNFDLRITHSGKSYFRCSTQYFKVSSPGIEFVMSFLKDTDGKPKSAGKSYKKLLDGDFLLSPYTKWTVQIEHENNDFSALANFKAEKLDVELIGFGQYVKGRKVCDENLHQYYEVANL